MIWQRITVICLFCFTSSLYAGHHVRVVLDTSISMGLPVGGNPAADPQQLAILSTTLLHDLANPKTVNGDSFIVIPFDQNKWKPLNPVGPDPCQGDIDPGLQSTALNVNANQGREQFVNKINNLKYKAQCTYFFPGLQKAVQQLGRVSNPEYDTKTIVLLTDGVSDGANDAELIRNRLVLQLEQQGIRVFVLAFGGAYGQQAKFQNMFISPTTGRSLATIRTVERAKDLSREMVELFSLSFGFETETKSLGSGLNLRSTGTPTRVALVLLTNDNSGIPTNTIKNSQGAQPNLAISHGNVKAGGSYRINWILNPSAGNHNLVASTSSGEIIILRPPELDFEIISAKTGETNPDSTMATADFPLKIKIVAKNSKGVAIIDTLQYNVCSKNTEDTNCQTYPTKEKRILGTGHLEFTITPKFWVNTDSANRSYTGYIELIARHQGNVVGYRRGLAEALKVTVYPYLSIVPNPENILGKTTTDETILEQRDDACVSFDLDMSAGVLPSLTGISQAYNIQAYIDIDSKTDPRLKQLNLSSFTLNNQSLGYRNGRQTWMHGIKLKKEQFLGSEPYDYKNPTYTLCTKVGKPLDTDPSSPVSVPVKFILNISPYDSLDVIKPFELKLKFKQQSWHEKWGAELMLGLLLFLLAALLWYLRNRPAIPNDLRYSLSVTKEGYADQSLQLFPQRSYVGRLLGLTDKRPISLMGYDQPLAYLKPEYEELYSVSMKKDMRIESGNNHNISQFKHKYLIQVNQDYKIISNTGKLYWFRLSYL